MSSIKFFVIFVAMLGLLFNINQHNQVLALQTSAMFDCRFVDLYRYECVDALMDLGVNDDSLDRSG